MNFKKRVNGSWTDIPHYIHNTSTDTITTLPAVIYPTGTMATVGLKGQTVQSSTPSSTSPVMPQGTGERTGNLFASGWEQGSIGSDGAENSDNTMVRTAGYIEIVYNTIYSMSRDKFSNFMNVRGYDANKTFIGTGTNIVELLAGTSTGNPMGMNTSFCCFKINNASVKYLRFCDKTNDLSTKYMMVEGEYTQQTMPEFEPYGIKIPISSANTTTPVYLGEVQTTRKIKKLVLTGEESITYDSVRQQFSFVANPVGGEGVPYCTHYKGTQIDVWNNLTNGYISFHPSDKRYWRICDTSIASSDAYKTYLQQQYAAGTPVTVFYVLATPETAVVNEPLQKIGNYADEVSGISIPVTAGGDTISVGTTVQPSEVTATYKGWHPVADVHERDNGAWD